MSTTFEKAREFIYRNARPIDFARWRYYFEYGSKDAVLDALSYYQNEDGGFGYALEADAWNTNSSPIQTWTATEILREINFIESEHPIIKGILGYLASGKDFTQNQWLNTVPTNNDYPHACWWECKNTVGEPSYNPTACLAGFILRFADWGTGFYQFGRQIAKEAVADYLTKDCKDKHELNCYIRLLEYCEKVNVSTLFDKVEFESKLKLDVHNIIEQNTAIWETEYVCKPSDFFNNIGSIFYKSNEALTEYECEFIINSQLADGSYSVNWQWWNDYKEFEITKNWWKSYFVISNMLFLKGFGKLEENSVY